MMETIWYHEKFRKLAGALISCALLGGLSGCGPGSARTQQPQGPMAMPVTMMQIGERMYRDEAEFMAEVDSKHSTDIHSQVSSRVVAVLAADGERVQAGQPLYQLDRSQQAATVRSYAAVRQASLEEPWSLQKSIEAQEADLAAAESDLAFNSKQLERYQELVKDHTVSQRDTEQYETTVLSQQQKVKGLQAAIASEEARRKEALDDIQRDTASFQSAQADLNYYTVRAPFSGTVGTLVAKIGDVVDPSTVLTTLTDNRHLEIDVALSVDYRSRVHLGTPMTLLTTDDQPLGESEVSYIEPKVDPLTQTVLVKARIANENGDLSVDQHLKARLILGTKRAILAPFASIFMLDGQPFVYCAEPVPDGKGKVARMTPVKLGPIVDQDVVIESGLKPGQTLITGGIQKLQDGVPVMELPSEPPQKMSH